MILAARGGNVAGVIFHRPRLQSRGAVTCRSAASRRLPCTLSVDSGYSSAAIRERVYLTAERAATGGIWVHAGLRPSQHPDGTCQGMAATWSRFSTA